MVLKSKLKHGFLETYDSHDGSIKSGPFLYVCTEYPSLVARPDRPIEIIVFPDDFFVEDISRDCIFLVGLYFFVGINFKFVISTRIIINANDVPPIPRPNSNIEGV